MYSLQKKKTLNKFTIESGANANMFELFSCVLDVCFLAGKENATQTQKMRFC